MNKWHYVTHYNDYANRWVCEARPDFMFSCMASTEEEALAICKYHVKEYEERTNVLPKILALIDFKTDDYYAQSALRAIKATCEHAIDNMQRL